MKSIIAALTLLSALVLSGCATNPNGAGNNYRAGLDQLRIGMPQSEAIALVGQPDRMSQTMTASGVSQQYVYSGSHFQTPGQQFLTGMQQGVEGVSHESSVNLLFQNGRLTAIQN